MDIYKLECTKNVRVYIVQSINAERRIKQHFWCLRRGIHYIPLLQSDFDAYGETAFTYSVLCEASKWEIRCEDGVRRPASSACEKAMMEKYKSYLPEFGYNYKDQYFYPHGGTRKGIPNKRRTP